MGLSDYRKLCTEKQIVAVVEQDKNNLKSYLTGEIDTCPQINLSLQQSQHASTRLAYLYTNMITYNLILALMHMLLYISVDKDAATVGSKRKADDSLTATTPSTTTASTVPLTGLQAERKALMELRKHEIPSQTRNSVLTKPNAVIVYFI